MISRRAAAALIALLPLPPPFLVPYAMASNDKSPDSADVADPFLWLEDVQGERALAWVREQNKRSEGLLVARPEYAPIRADLLSVLDSKERIPYVTRRGDWFYNFWQDDQHRRGLWRRTTLDEYTKPDPRWDVVLDLDALAKAEGENWVWGGAAAYGPSYRRCLVFLSRGGADAKVVREFDSVDKAFVKDGFELPEAKSSVDWIDEDTLFVGTDFGPGSMTDSGYPRIIKRWKRGTPLAEAVTVFEAEQADVSADVAVHRDPGFERIVFSRAIDFYNRKQFLLGPADRLQPIDLPDDASLDFHGDTVLLELRSDLALNGTTFPSGSLLTGSATAFLNGERRLEALFTPTPTRSLAGYTVTRDHILVSVLDNVASRLEEWRRHEGRLVRREVAAPYPGTLGVGSLHDPLLADDQLANRYVITYTDFLTPDSLYLATTGSDDRQLLKSRPALFDAEGMRAEQHFATSRDGTEVPYFVIWPRGVSATGDNPTLLYGYGGFEVSLQPWYSGGYGKAWFNRGGVLVVANIRGGGEFGPAWHQAAVKANKQRSYDDFAAVAEDLIARKVTSPRHLGIQGGSNGGLLVGATFVQRPELFNAVVCQVPLLDMKRYHLLLAGASWMAEYGNPDEADEWAFISKYSPYQNLKPDVRYPEVLFATSTRDDRVHPGHARKMAALMQQQGHEFLYYENIEGGHGGAADNEQRAHLMALEYSYLWRQLAR